MNAEGPSDIPGDGILIAIKWATDFDQWNIYVDDMTAGIFTLMQSDLEGPANIGTSEYVTVKELVDTITSVAGKDVSIQWVEGPVGVQSRNFSASGDRGD